MSSRAHARRRLAAWDRYLRSCGHKRGEWRTSAAFRFGRADYRWWVRANRHRRR